MTKEEKKHISFSELKIWHECSMLHKFVYIDELPVSNYGGPVSAGAFGTAMHRACQSEIVDPAHRTTLFFETLDAELAKLSDQEKEKLKLEERFVNEGRARWPSVIPDVQPAMQQYFGDFEIVAVELPLYEPIDDLDWNFKGYVDMVLKTSDGKIHIVDFKTTSSYWDARKKSDPMTTYQLTLYKMFYAQKFSVPLDDIETHFILLKRGAKKNPTEIFRVTSGDKKMQNAKKLLLSAVNCIRKERYIKNRLSCRSCKLFHTELCK